MKYPKINFKIMSLEDNIDLVQWAFFEKDNSLDIYSYTINYFPELKNINLQNYSKKEINFLIKKIVSNNYHQKLNEIKKAVDKYDKVWQKYNNDYFKALTSYLNIQFPPSIEIITAYVGLIPIFPRYLDTFSFAISKDVNEKTLIETCAHESCHFLWFIKWKEIYPLSKKEEFESPHLTWKYSEMVIDSLLNSKEINKILKISAKAYDSFYKLKDGNSLVMDRIKQIYNSDDLIEDKIQNGYIYLKNYFKKVN